MRISLRHTTTFWLTVFASLAFIAVGGAVLGFLYWSMLFVIDGQIGGALSREVSDMTAAYDKGGYERLRRTVADRASPHEDTVRIYLLIGPDGRLTGNLQEWPAHAPQPGPPRILRWGMRPRRPVCAPSCLRMEAASLWAAR